MPLPTTHLPKTENDSLRARAEALHLYGLLTHWSEVATQPWLAPMLDWEEQQRARRSLERRLSAAHIGRFKPLCDFDWTWPKHCDRAAVDARDERRTLSSPCGRAPSDGSWHFRCLQALANNHALAILGSVPEVRALPSTGVTRPQQ
jgi:hypothetical protein